MIYKYPLTKNILSLSHPWASRCIGFDGLYASGFKRAGLGPQFHNPLRLAKGNTRKFAGKVSKYEYEYERIKWEVQGKG